MKQAVIDIGSNSVRLLLVKEKLTSKQIITTRLAEGSGDEFILKSTPMERTVNAVKEFVGIARNAGADDLFVFATESVRKAANKDEFLSLLNPLKIKVDVLTGEEEAKIGYYGARAEGKTLVDVGGASTEFYDGVTAQSFPIGTVKIYDKCGCDINAILS